MEPLSAAAPELTIDDAYAIQRAQVDVWLAAGRTIRGYKIGLTSKAMQAQLGVDQPDFGVLLADMFVPAGDPVPVERFPQPRAEPELAFVLDRDLAGPGLTIDEVAAAVRSVHPALEIIDSADRRLADRTGRAHRRQRVVRWRRAGRRAGGGPGPTWPPVECVFEVNGEVFATGVGGDVQGAPLGAMTWLVNRLGEFGVRLRAGHVVLSGSITRAVPVAAGDRVSAAFPGLGAVAATFA